MCGEKVREYVLATGGDDPLSDEGDGELLVPPTFAACFTLNRGWDAVYADPDLGAHPKLLHASQEFEFSRAVGVGDVLKCTPWIVSIAPRGRHEFLTLQIDCVEQPGGAPVLTSRGTLVFLDSAPER